MNAAYRVFLFVAALISCCIDNAHAQSPTPNPSPAPANATVMTGTQTQVIAGQKIFQSAGNQGSPLVAWSQSGASAHYVLQDTHFDNPALVVLRDGTNGNTTTTPTLLVQAGHETAWNQPILQVGGCLALSGDNWYIVWGDGALSFPGCILDNAGKTYGKAAIDQVHRQLIGPDGITPALTWSGSNGVTISTARFTLTLILPPSASAPSVPSAGQIYFNTSDKHFYGWNGAVWKQLDN